MKKIIAAVAASLLVLSLTACTPTVSYKGGKIAYERHSS